VKTIKTKYSKLTLNTEDIFKEIERAELSRRREAAQLAAKDMRRNASGKGVSRPGDFPSKMSGEVRRSIGYKLLKHDKAAQIGSKSFKIHLLEFGHGDGKVRNKRPLITPSLRESEPEIIRIMSKRYF
jgi:hypothetical protein